MTKQKTIKERLSEIIESFDKESLNFHNLHLFSELSGLINSLNHTGDIPGENDDIPPIPSKNNKNICIGIVDDDKNIQNLLRVYLERSGYQTKSYLNPATALKLVEKDRPEILFVDLMMPEMSGITFINELKKSETLKKIKIIVGSAKTGHIDRENALKAGAVDFIQKPYNLNELLHKVQQHLTNKNAESKL